MIDPYRSVGLDRNPFVAEISPGVAPGHWTDRGLPTSLTLRPLSFIQVVGPKGAGKTSHLLRWRAELSGPYRHVAPGWGRLASLPVAPVAYWDEADRAAWLWPTLRRQSRIGGMVVVGTHIDLSDQAHRAGFIVESHELGPLSPAEIEEFCVKRIAEVGGRPDLLSGVDLESVARRAGASLREAGRLLHIETARRVRAGAVNLE